MISSYEMLMQMKVHEIKLLLKGVKRISRLRKKELVAVLLDRYDYSSLIVGVLSKEEREKFGLNHFPVSPTPQELIQIDQQLDKCIFETKGYYSKSSHL